MVYSDINNDKAYKKPLVTDLESVHQSVRNIMSIRKGQLLFLPQLGLTEENLIFEFVDDTGALILLQSLFNEINLWDDRVILDYANSNVIPDYDNNSYTATISYRVKGLEDVFSITEII
jgi:phage baseplate assembly protein W